MKTSLSPVLPFLLGAMFATGCQAIGDIFKAGVWVGILAVGLVIGLVAFGASALRK